jgi:hypothetical protein
MAISRLPGFLPVNFFNASIKNASSPFTGNAGNSRVTLFGNSGGSSSSDADSTLEEGFLLVKGALKDTFGEALNVLQDAPQEVQDAVVNTFTFQMTRDAVANALGN